MASFAGRQRTSVPWSIDDASTFAAQKEFKLLQLLSNDKKALATARRLGLMAALPQPPPAGKTPGKAAATSTQRAPDAPSEAPAKSNSRCRRSSERSARRHAAQREQQSNRLRTACLFKRWKLCCRARSEALQQDLADLSTIGDGSDLDSDSNSSPMEELPVRQRVAPKRNADRPPSSSSSSSAASSRSSSSDTPVGSYEGNCPTVQPGRGGWKKGRLDQPAYKGRM